MRRAMIFKRRYLRSPLLEREPLRRILARFLPAYTRTHRLPWPFVGGLVAAILATTPAAAAEYAGIMLPDKVQALGKTLVLNGAGLRTFSVLDVHIYVIGLYLPKPDHDPQAILNSPGPKMLLLYFVHDVPAEKVRNAWKQGLNANCVLPCVLPPALLSRFLAFLPAVSAGETVELLFGPKEMQAYFNGKLAGTISDPDFARLMLEAWLGPHPASPDLKAALLGAQG